MTYRYPGSFNSFVPAATGQVISFIRNPEQYKINKYVQFVRSEKSVGVYYKINPDDVTRMEALDEHVFADGAKRPEDKHVGIRHDLVEFQTIRYSFGFNIGWKTIEQADYKVLVGYTALARNQAMIHRTQRVITLLETTGNWPSGNTAAANTLNGGAGFWDQASSDPSSPNFLAIKKTLDAALLAVHLQTNGAVADFEGSGKPPFLLILSPGDALKMSESSEIHNYLAQSPFALAQVTGKVVGQNARWGLPDQLYGIVEIVVEDAVRVSERPKASGAAAATTGSPAPRRFVKADDSAVLIPRPQSIDGQYGAPSFSTVQMYYYRVEMSVETEDDKWNRLTKGSVVIDDKEVLSAGTAGYLVTNTMS